MIGSDLIDLDRPWANTCADFRSSFSVNLPLSLLSRWTHDYYWINCIRFSFLWRIEIWNKEIVHTVDKRKTGAQFSQSFSAISCAIVDSAWIQKWAQRRQTSFCIRNHRRQTNRCKYTSRQRYDFLNAEFWIVCGANLQNANMNGSHVTIGCVWMYETNVSYVPTAQSAVRVFVWSEWRQSHVHYL